MAFLSSLRGRIRNNAVLRNAQAFRNYIYDFQRFRAHSSAMDAEVSAQAIAARITKEYHRLEKGMALPAPRPGFGKATIDYLLTAVPRLESRAGACLATRGARGSMRQYVAFHDAQGHAEMIPHALRTFVAASGPDLPGGAFSMTRADLLAATAMDFDRFARARYSIRQFTGAPVPEAAIISAIGTALKSPRVCNRESRRVHAGFDPALRERMLSFQNGNRGFGHLAGAILVITSDLRHFTDFGERNQAFVDGGLFAMTLALALHGQGYGTCFLNWSAPFWRDRDMRRALGIPDHEAVVTFLAVGCLPDRFDLAISPAPEVAEVFRKLG
jgi:nitroreductase